MIVALNRGQALLDRPVAMTLGWTGRWTALR